MIIETFEPTAVYRKEPDGRFFVFCREVEGVSTEGKTLAEARRMIKEALEGVIEVVLAEDFANYFRSSRIKIKKSDILESIEINKKLQVAVSIRLAREKAGLTQKQMASKIGLKQQHISRYEKGQVLPSADKFLKLVSVPPLHHKHP